MSYTRLLEESEIYSTGLLNYHLKIIGDLLEKNNIGEYILTEKGKIASKLLEEYPKDNTGNRRITFEPKFLIVFAVFNTINLVAVTSLYLLGLINFGFFIATVIGFAGAITVTCIGYRYGMPPAKIIEKNSNMLLYIIFGAAISGFFALFGTAFISVISTSMGGPNVLRLIGRSHFHVAFYCLSLTVIGASVAYLIGKQRSFSRPKWVIWLEEHFPH